jgi:hypothetical protein
LSGLDEVAVLLDDDAEDGVSILSNSGCICIEKGDFGRELSFFETIIQSIYKMLDLRWYKDSSPKTLGKERLELGSNNSRTFEFRSVHTV